MRWRAAPLLVCGLLLAGPASAADLYVSPMGSDGGDGSRASPFATFTHALGQASSGDTLYLERGGTYQASGVRVNNLTVTEYGSGALPILTASMQADLPNRWGSDMNVQTGPVGEEVLAVYVDGRFVRRARYPNTGFIRTDNAQDPDTIVAAELANRPGVAAGRWTGAQVRWRRWSWWWETRPIDAHESVDTLRLGLDGRFQDPYSDIGSGFFIDGDLDELDVPGEWHWEDGTLYVYPPSWADPANMRVDVVTTEDVGVRATGSTFRGVHFSRYAGTALEINGPTTVEDCAFTELEVLGIEYTFNAQPFTIRRSVFRDVRNVAIIGWTDPNGQPGTRIERNLLHRIGIERGYGGSGSWHAAGMIIGAGNGLEITLNRIVDTGYAGVILGGDGHRVFRNVFARTMSTLNDGAAVYTNCNASDIRENIILDSIGDLEYSHPWWPLAHGIWPEFLGSYRDTQIVGNTIFGPNGYGVFLPNNFDCTVDGNLTVASRLAGMSLTGNGGDQQSHIIRNNTLASFPPPAGRLVRPENLNAAWLPPNSEPMPVGLQYQADVDFGQMLATTFVTGGAGSGLARDDATQYDSIAAWTGAASWADGTNSRAVSAGGAVLLFNDTEMLAEVAVPAGSWTDLGGNPVGANVSLEPFDSVLLVSDAGNPGAPYVAASGIDWRLDTPTTTYLTLEPELAVSRGGAPVQNGGVDEVGVLGLTEAALTYRLHNQGGAALTVGAVSFSEATNCTVRETAAPSASLAPSAATALGVGVTPSAEGAWSVRVSFDTNDTDENPATWIISGTAEAGATPDAGVTPDGAVPPDAGTGPDGAVVTPDGGVAPDGAVLDGGKVWDNRAIEGGCTCATPDGAGAGLWGLLGLAALLGRRRR